MPTNTTTVVCRVCGDKTIFINGTPENDHITEYSSGKFKCNSCGITSDDSYLSNAFEITTS
jgi:transposase